MKNLLTWAGALALALFPSLAFGQAATSVQAPAGYAPLQAPCVKQTDNSCLPVSAANPFPMQPAISAASSTPCSAVVTTSAATPTGCGASFASGTATIGGFAPQLGRNLRVLITGTWAGTVTVGTSGNSGCSTFNPLTIGGSQWGVFTANANEFVDTPSIATAYYCIKATVSSGSPNVSFLQ